MHNLGGFRMAPSSLVYVCCQLQCITIRHEVHVCLLQKEVKHYLKGVQILHFILTFRTTFALHPNSVVKSFSKVQFVYTCITNCMFYDPINYITSIILYVNVAYRL